MPSPFKSQFRRALYFGSIVTAAIALLPFLNDFLVIAYVVGALASVLFAIRRDRQILSFKNGAQLGFQSGFYGVLTASAIYDVVWQFLNWRIWQIPNLERWLSIFQQMLQNLLSPSAWLIITLQIIACAIFAGAFGAPAGILGVKLFRRQP